MQKKKKKSSSREGRQPVSEMTAQKPWRDFIEGLPAGQQRLGVNALLAWEKGNASRMEQYVKQLQLQMPGDSPCLMAFQMLLYGLYKEQANAAPALRQMKWLLAAKERSRALEGGEREDFAARLSFVPEEARDFLLSSDQRGSHMLRCDYALLIAHMDCCEEAAEIFEEELSFEDRDAGLYVTYLMCLERLKRDGELMRLAREVLSAYAPCLEEAQAEEAERESITEEKAGAVIHACFTMLLALEQGGMHFRGQQEEADQVARKLVLYRSLLPEEIKEAPMVQAVTLLSVTKLRELLEDLPYLPPVIKIAEALRSEAVPAEDKSYEKLLFSLHWGLESIEWADDHRIDGMAGELLHMLVAAQIVLTQKPGLSSEDEKNARLGIAVAKWCLCRYQMESDGNKDRVRKGARLVRESYPALWDFISDDMGEIFADPEAAMEKEAGIIGRLNGRNKEDTALDMEVTYRHMYTEFEDS